MNLLGCHSESECRVAVLRFDATQRQETKLNSALVVMQESKVPEQAGR